MSVPTKEQLAQAAEFADTFVPRHKNGVLNVLEVIKSGVSEANCFARVSLVAARLAVDGALDGVEVGVGVERGLVVPVFGRQRLGHTELFSWGSDSSGQVDVIDPRKHVELRTIDEMRVTTDGHDMVRDAKSSPLLHVGLYDVMTVEEAVRRYQETEGAVDGGSFNFDELVDYVEGLVSYSAEEPA